MASRALQDWQTVRTPRLRLVSAQCTATATVADLGDQNLRAFVLLLSAEFQGFCRELHTECVQIVSLAVPPLLKQIVQSLGMAARELDKGNARFESIKSDYDRFDIEVGDHFKLDPANAIRVTHLDRLNSARNFVAHHKQLNPSGGPLVLSDVVAWMVSCDGVASVLEDMMYNHLQSSIGTPPW